uniref:AB hydrolase-1 domain-containing protein n=2 Tax=Octactis speculum TaxID=3111310 RepID=A0A7S2CAL4_9STRA
MQDEYGDLDAGGETYYFDGEFKLEFGKSLFRPQVRYRTWGDPKNPTLVVAHALTGNAGIDTWWGEIMGEGKALDSSENFIICMNILGSCYGSTGPMSRCEKTGEVYGDDFPLVSVRDTVRLHMHLLHDHLGIRRVSTVIGGSLGGMQALEWLLCAPEQKLVTVDSAVVIACGAEHNAWQIGISETQRQALRLHKEDGLRIARQIAMIAYRSPVAYRNKFGRERTTDGRFQVASYLEYQGRKFLSRFDPTSYYAITEQMDTHDVGRGRGGIEAALSSLSQRILIMGISSDVLYPLEEQQELARLIPNAGFFEIVTDEGHDGFLLEYDQVGSAISTFIGSLSHRQKQVAEPFISKL